MYCFKCANYKYLVEIVLIAKLIEKNNVVNVFIL